MTDVPESGSSSDWDSSDVGVDYENVFCLPPGYTMIPISVAGPDDLVDENGQALAAGSR